MLDTHPELRTKTWLMPPAPAASAAVQAIDGGALDMLSKVSAVLPTTRQP